MLPFQNEQQQELEITEVLSDIVEELLAVDFTDEARKPKMISVTTTKNLKYLWSSPSGEREVETVPTYAGRRHSANIM